MPRPQTLLLSRKDVHDLLRIEDCIPAVEAAFRMHAGGKAAPPKVLSVHASDGGFHIKAGILGLSRNYFVAKTNANFPGNMQRHGLPTIQGVVVVCDADDGRLLALMDTIELTIIRTGAATAVAAKYLALKNASTVTICGCGNQGRISLMAVAQVRQITRAYTFDLDERRAQSFSEEMSQVLGIVVTPTDSISHTAAASQICVTCTPSRQPLLHRGDVGPGCFIAAVGADNEEKQEIDPYLIAESKLVVDLREQSAAFGDLHHALALGIVTPAHVHAELGEIIAGKKPGRTSDEEIIVFDSTGTALQDVVAAAIVYENAVKVKRGKEFEF